MCSYIASVEALERFKIECKKHEQSLLNGESQLCLDALLFISPVSCSDSFVRSDGEQSAKLKLPIVLSGDEYLLNLIGHCPNIKVIFPCMIAFNGFVDLSLLESCNTLELVGVPFQRLTGIDCLRKNLQSLVWNRGYEEHERGNFKIFQHGDFINDRTFKIDDVFWDQFGQWSKLKTLSFSRSSLLALNTSSMPATVTSLNLSMNRMSRFHNSSSVPSNLTALCLDYNQLTQLPKLDSITASKLVHLSLRGNLISTVKDLQKFQSLKFLNLASNALCDIRELLTEIGHLSRTLTSLNIDDNPVTHHRDFYKKCRFALYKLGSLNGRSLSPLKADDEQQSIHYLPVVNYGSTLQDQGSQSFQTAVAASSELDDSMQRSRRERLVMINENGDGNDSDIPENARHRLTSGQSASTNDILVLPKKDAFTAKNYLFGDVSGSYGSFHTQLDTLQNSQQEELNLEREKLLEKRKELGENWLLNGGQATASSTASSSPMMMSNSLKIPEIHVRAHIPERIEEEDGDDDGEKQVREKQDKVLDDTSEWDLEDTQEEENVFLVECYDTWDNLTKAQASNFQTPDMRTQFLFIRFRPEDLLLFEKDCTSGKILTTLDLKILESFQTIKDSDDSASGPVGVQLLFDTSVLSKRERVYRFVEDGQCETFLDILSKRQSMKDLRSEAELSSNSGSGAAIQFSSTPHKDTPALWLYLCLRCGSKTPRIITDCPKCGSQLIVKDVGEKLESKLSTPIAATPTNEFSVPEGDKSYVLDTSVVDEGYFDADHAHHVVKLMTEVAIYDIYKTDNEQLKNESVQSICQCLIFNFNIKLFVPGVVVFSEHHIFLFEQRDEQLKLKFYYAFVGPHQFVLSHLPEYLKNHAFWFQCVPFNLSRKRNRKKEKKAKVFDTNSPCLELIMFDDKIVGKAFLEHLFQSHRVCYRKLDTDTNLQRNLPVIKPDIMEVIHDASINSAKHDSKIGAVLDDQLSKILDAGQLAQFNERDALSEPYFFLIKRFSLNLESKTQESKNQDLLNVEQNLLLLLSQENFVLCQLSGHFYAISGAITSGSSLSMAKLLRSRNSKFDDHIELRLLMRDSLLNLLPTVYVLEHQNRIILKFRDENGTIMSFTNSFAGNGDGESGEASSGGLMDFESSGKSSLMVYDFELEFYSSHAMKRVLEQVQTVWERHFGVALTLSVKSDS